MNLTPGRAPFVDGDEDFAPLRLPKSAPASPAHNLFNAAGASPVTAGVSIDVDHFGRTISPTKLSPFAKEFVPRFGGGSGGGGVGGGGAAASGSNTSSGATAKRYSMPNNYQQHAAHQQHQYGGAQQQQQRYQTHHQRHSNGYQQQQQHHHQQHHQQQQQHHQHNQQYSQQQQQMNALNNSVQQRLRIGDGSGSGSSGAAGISTGARTANNYYNNQQPQTRYHKNNAQYHYNNYNARYARNGQQQQQQQQQAQQQQQQQQQKAGAAAAAADGAATNVEAVALEYLKTVISCLNQNPGQFDSVATRFITIFDGLENNEYVLSIAMEDIFSESIENPNFRYMGAKLYNLLHALNLKPDSVFHQMLKQQLEYYQSEVEEYMRTNQQHKVRETALFLAELYMQLRGDDSRIQLIAQNIVYSLKQLLQRESSDNVRCICLTLKLAGYDLTGDCAAQMHDIIAELDAINRRAPGKYPLAANVITLQQSNWGRKLSASNSICDANEAPKLPEPLRISDEPIFYGPDGRELTAEETDFLAGGGSASSVSNGLSDDAELDNEMDEEAARDYENFCKMSGSK